MTPDRGDILHMAFDPAAGHEMKGDHYCLVLTPKLFNGHFGLAWVLPITSGRVEKARGLTAVTLMGTGLKVTGNVVCHEIKALDWASRSATFVDRLSGPVLQHIINLCLAILDPKRAGVL